MNRIKEIKQVWLTQQLGKCYNIVNGYLQNMNQLSSKVLNQIVQILDVDVKELLESNIIKKK